MNMAASPTASAADAITISARRRVRSLILPITAGINSTILVPNSSVSRWRSVATKVETAQAPHGHLGPHRPLRRKGQRGTRVSNPVAVSAPKSRRKSVQPFEIAIRFPLENINTLTIGITWLRKLSSVRAIVAAGDLPPTRHRRAEDGMPAQAGAIRSLTSRAMAKAAVAARAPTIAVCSALRTGATPVVGL